MATIEFQTQINAPPEEVFAYLADLEKHPEWLEAAKQTVELRQKTASAAEVEISL